MMMIINIFFLQVNFGQIKQMLQLLSLHKFGSNIESHYFTCTYDTHHITRLNSQYSFNISQVLEPSEHKKHIRIYANLMYK